MPGRKPRTSRVLILIAVLMSLAFGLAVPQSSSTPSPIEGQHMPDMFVAKDSDSDTDADSVLIPTPQTETSSEKDPSNTSTETADSETEATQHQVSPEAEKGIWTSIDGIWYFLVDGTPYRGWLYDADGNTYYFNNKDGSMKTGWLKKDGKRYYFDLDGIMQTGNITVDGETYHLLPNGSQEGYIPEETPVPEKAKKEKTAQKENKTKEPKEKKTIALTFDDGPSSFTGRLLDCLEKNNAKATFFMVGKEIESFPDEVKRMKKLGCELGNHTYSHTDLTTLSSKEISNEIGTVDKLLYDLAGHGATIVRPPYGSINDNVRYTVGTPMMLWSVDTLDWETEDVQKIVDTVMSSAEDGAVILMHDIFKTSVDAAEIIIPKLIKEGYDLVTVHELAKQKGITMEPGIAYGAM